MGTNYGRGWCSDAGILVLQHHRTHDTSEGYSSLHPVQSEGHERQARSHFHLSGLVTDMHLTGDIQILVIYCQVHVEVANALNGPLTHIACCVTYVQ